MAWTFLLLAGLLEIFWASSMKQSQGFTLLIPSVVTVVLMFASFVLLALAMKTLPLGTSYAIWTGIGAVGAFVTGIVFFGEAVTATRVIALALIVAGIVLMRLSETV
ncbi:MAG: quaternary ammonium compound-resistance protein SugE [Rhodobacteraceae bacterium HLUCCA12]|nr:MAG: quaternary ammonium compound-resistance protein SugE [Rhodobacteraceae bacterium HLUCCA12]